MVWVQTSAKEHAQGFQVTPRGVIDYPLGVLYYRGNRASPVVINAPLGLLDDPLAITT